MDNQALYSKAKTYLFSKYEKIMSLYSVIYTQIDLEMPNATSEQKGAVSAYYTVVSHKVLNDFPIISKIDAAIKKNQDKKLEEVDSELAVAILVESRIHELEKHGFVKVFRSNGDTVLELTDKGKVESLKLGEDLRKGYAE